MNFPLPPNVAGFPAVAAAAAARDNVVIIAINGVAKTRKQVKINFFFENFKCSEIRNNGKSKKRRKSCKVSS